MRGGGTQTGGRLGDLIRAAGGGGGGGRGTGGGGG